MESAFIDFLDQLYQKGYAEDFKENNPDAYYSQLVEFENQYSHKHNDTLYIFNGLRRSQSRPAANRSRQGIRNPNAGQR